MSEIGDCSSSSKSSQQIWAKLGMPISFLFSQFQCNFYNQFLQFRVVIEVSDDFQKLFLACTRQKFLPFLFIHFLGSQTWLFHFYFYFL
jgi:hypothetical protein